MRGPCIVRSDEYLRAAGDPLRRIVPGDALELGGYVVVVVDEGLHLCLALRSIVEKLMLLGKEVGHLCEELLGCQGLDFLIGESCGLDIFGTLDHIPVECA